MEKFLHHIRQALDALVRSLSRHLAIYFFTQGVTHFEEGFLIRVEIAAVGKFKRPQGAGSFLGWREVMPTRAARPMVRISQGASPMLSSP